MMWLLWVNHDIHVSYAAENDMSDIWNMQRHTRRYQVDGGVKQMGGGLMVATQKQIRTILDPKLSLCLGHKDNLPANCPYLIYSKVQGLRRYPE
jgi:hypothetical protein